MLPKIIKGAFIGIKFLIKVPWRKIGKEGQEAIAAIKAVKFDGHEDRAEIEKAFKEVIDVVDIIIPNFKIVYEMIAKKSPGANSDA